MSIQDKFVSNSEVMVEFGAGSIPVNDGRDFSIKRVAVDSLEYDAYLRLRANVYIDQTHILGVEARRKDGSETDGDDKRSMHYLVTQREMGSVAAFGCMRLIQKTASANAKLPVEESFPEVFSSSPVPLGGIEVSRFIVRHDNRRANDEARSNLLMSALAQTHESGQVSAYAVVEPLFERHLLRLGVPVERVSDLKWIDEYDDYNAAIRIDTDRMIERIGADTVRRFLLSEIEDYRSWGDTNHSDATLSFFKRKEECGERV